MNLSTFVIQTAAVGRAGQTPPRAGLSHWVFALPFTLMVTVVSGEKASMDP